jgi:hypothetical protein
MGYVPQRRAIFPRPRPIASCCWPPDEPTVGIQPSIIKAIGRTIMFLKSTTRMAILLVEQWLDFCREIADHVYVIDRGDMVHSGLATDLDDANVRRHLTVRSPRPPGPACRPAFDGKLVARIAVVYGMALRRALVPLLASLRGAAPLPKVWVA